MRPSMPLVSLPLVLLLLVPAWAGDPPAKPEAAPAPVPAVASADELREALATFKTEWKAKGRKGEQRLAWRIFAMKTLARTQHRKVVDELFKLTRNSDENVRTAAVQYLGLQRALVGPAGAKVVAAMKKHGNDAVIQISGLQAIQDLGYYDVEDLLRALIKHKDYAVQKSAYTAIANLKDMRLLEDVYRMLKEIKAAQGDSWDGVSVSVDTGAAGDKDQRAAEKKGREQMAKNKRRARRARRAQRDLGPVVSEALEKLTGETFTKEQEARAWMQAHAKEIAAAKAALAERAKAQREAAR